MIRSLSDIPPVSIRKNPFKNFRAPDNLEKIPWSDQGYYLEERPAFYAEPKFHAGAYYVQEASSMILELILKYLDFDKYEIQALDMCAAPGGKSTILSSFLKNKGVLISNELVWKRNLILQENLSRWGLNNTIITHNSSRDFRSLENVFDLVLVDAPCSGEGMFRKDSGAIKEWSPGNIDICVERQKTILSDIAGSLRKGGVLIYSTCTYNRAENEDQIDEFIDENGFESIQIKNLDQFGILESKGNNCTFYRLFPHRLKGEGLSISVLRKTSEHYGKPKKGSKGYNQKIIENQALNIENWLNENENSKIFQRENEIFSLDINESRLIEKINKHLKIIKPGTHIGDLKGEKFIPSHSLALNCSISKEVQRLELSKEDALRVLQKDTSNLTIPDSDYSWFGLCYEGDIICFAKKVNNRMNIHLPKTFRIRKNIDEYLI